MVGPGEPGGVFRYPSEKYINGLSLSVVHQTSASCENDLKVTGGKYD